MKKLTFIFVIIFYFFIFAVKAQDTKISIETLKSNVTEYFKVTKANYFSIKNDKNASKVFFEELNTYLKTAPEDLNLGKVAKTMGFKNESEYKNILTNINKSISEIKKGYEGMPNDEIVKIIKIQWGNLPAEGVIANDGKCETDQCSV